MELIIDGKVISESIEVILKKLREETGNKYFKYIGREKQDNVLITCPFHKDGQENKPSCYVYASENHPTVSYGTVHCFTCGEKMQLYSLVAYCFNSDDSFGKEWLVKNFGSYSFTKDYIFESDIDLGTSRDKFLDESILEQYAYFHPYMFERHLTEEVILKFKIGYDCDSKCITFPVWDEHNRLLMVTRRSVLEKKFFIPPGIDKPPYLLNFAISGGHSTVIVCEGQFDALVSWSYGVPAVSMFGAGTTKHQMDLINGSGISNFILMYDNDDAGRHGATRFKKMVREDKFVTEITMPIGKDIGSCTKEEFYSILSKNEISLKNILDK